MIVKKLVVAACAALVTVSAVAPPTVAGSEGPTRSQPSERRQAVTSGELRAKLAPGSGMDLASQDPETGSGPGLAAEGDEPDAPTLVPNDPLWPDQVALGADHHGFTRAWARTTGRPETVIAFVGYGVAPVSELQGRLLPGWDVERGAPGGHATPGFEGDTGLAVAAAGRGNNGVGIAGGCWECTVLPVKVTDWTWSVPQHIEAIRWAVDHGADIIVTDLARSSSPQPAYDAVLDYARQRSVVVMSPTDVLFTGPPRFPAANEGVLSTANAQDPTWALFAGPSEVPTQFSDGRFWSVGGPPAGTATLAGLGALALSVDPCLGESTIWEGWPDLAAAFAEVSTPVAGTYYGRPDGGVLVDWLLGSIPVSVAAPGPSGPFAGRTTVEAAVPPGFEGEVAVIAGCRVVGWMDAAPWQLDVDLSHGVQDLTVAAFGADGSPHEGEYGYSLPVQLEVDREAPRVSIHTAPGSLFGVETILVSATDEPAGLDGPPTLKVGTTTLPLRAAGAGRWTATWDTRPIAEGARVLSATAKDRLGRSRTVTTSVRVLNRPPASGFVDVPRDAFYAASVDWLARTGVTTGVSAVRFDPGARVTRAQMAVFLWRLAGQPASKATRFADVPAGSYYDTATRWLRAAGITTGVGGRNRFDPDAAVTRGQMVTFLHRFSGQRETLRYSFDDVPWDAFYARAVWWARTFGITTGVGGTNRFEPDAAVTRGQMAAFLFRYARTRAAMDLDAIPIGV